MFYGNCSLKEWSRKPSRRIYLQAWSFMVVVTLTISLFICGQPALSSNHQDIVIRLTNKCPWKASSLPLFTHKCFLCPFKSSTFLSWVREFSSPRFWLLPNPTLVQDRFKIVSFRTSSLACFNFPWIVLTIKNALFSISLFVVTQSCLLFDAKIWSNNSI